MISATLFPPLDVVRHLNAPSFIASCLTLDPGQIGLIALNVPPRERRAWEQYDSWKIIRFLEQYYQPSLTIAGEGGLIQLPS